MVARHLLVYCLGLSVAPPSTAPAATLEVFVDAVSGRDSADGTTPATAFATLRRARQAVRQLPRPPPSAAEGDGSPLAIVSLRSAGTHWLHRAASDPTAWAADPLSLTAADSGAPGRPVVWRTHPSDPGTATVSAGFPIPAGWKQAPQDPGLWQVRVPAVAAGHVCPQQLWATPPSSGSSGRRLTRARLPSEGFFQWHAALDPTNHTSPANLFGFVFGDDFTKSAEALSCAHLVCCLSASYSYGCPWLLAPTRWPRFLSTDS